MDDQQIIDECMASLNALDAAKKTDQQLAAWIATFKSAQPGTPNYPLLQACKTELAKRMRETLVTHPNGKCYGHLEWTDKGTTLVLDHCECQYEGKHPEVGCAKCGEKGIPVIGHRCP